MFFKDNTVNDSDLTQFMLIRSEFCVMSTLSMNEMF